MGPVPMGPMGPMGQIGPMGQMGPMVTMGPMGYGPSSYGMNSMYGDGGYSGFMNNPVPSPG
jgi:hypothetical protein